MTSTAMGNVGIMTIFDFILIVYGIYSITTARKMKQDHQVPQWLVSQQDLLRIRQPKEFCDLMAPKTMIFGFICAIYGLYELAVEAFLKNQIAEAVGIVFFVIGIAWFLTQLNKAKKKYM
mgnify:CR=1 FL=1